MIVRLSHQVVVHFYFESSIADTGREWVDVDRFCFAPLLYYIPILKPSLLRMLNGHTESNIIWTSRGNIPSTTVYMVY